MNSRIASILSVRGMRILAALCAGFFLTSTAPAQLAPSQISGRYLLIFDTSSAMKKRVSATQHAVERLFFTMMDGQLQPGDTIGVWTFNRKLRAGEFPLQHWLPQNAAQIALAVTNFVQHQHYSRSTRFDAIMPDVNNLVRSSEQLTVLIFCDGEGEIKGTPFDNQINAIFKKNERALKNVDQTYVVVLRSQLGQYTGYSVNSSAIGVSFPEFPPLPAPPQPAAPPPTNLPPVQMETNPPPPVVHLPPLVIIGTNIGTNLIPAIPPQTELSNPPPTAVISNPPPEVASNPPPAVAALTNSINAVSPPVAKAQTNAPAGPEENPSGLSRNGALAIGAVLLVAAAGLIIFALVRSRKASRGSLITRSMKKK